MKFFILAVCVAAVAAQKRPDSGRGDVGNSGDRFDPNSRNPGRSPDRFVDTSGGDRISASKGNGGDGGARFPDYARIEIEVQRLENKGGLRKDGKTCDFNNNACDPRVYAYLDADKPSSPWPGSLPVKQWPSIFEATDNNSPTIGKSVNRDICGGSASKVNLRVYVVDVDVGANDDMNNFECIFDIDPRDIARDAGSAQWGPSIECKAAVLGDKMKLFARQRAYQIPSTSCRADASGNKQGIDSGSMSSGGKVLGQHDNIRIDVEVVQLLNPQGILATKKSCDLTSKCDPRINAYLDTDKPLAAWPGSKTVPEYPFLFEAANQDSPVVNKNVSKNICGGSVGKVNLRAHVVDVNTLGSNGFIADFECLFDADYRLVARDVSSADWSSTQDCRPLNPAIDVRLQYRFRLYDIVPAECGIKG